MVDRLAFPTVSQPLGNELERAFELVASERTGIGLSLKQEQLAQTIFPLGEMTKAGLEKLAQGEFGGEKLFEAFDEAGLRLRVRLPDYTIDPLARRLRDISRGAASLRPDETPPA
mgnify:CR=1 FL=1